MQSAFINLPNIRLHYLDSGSTAATRATLVFSHGLTANARMFEPLANLLTPDYRVIAVDLRGRGLSDKPSAGYSMAEHAADIIGLMDALGLERCIVGGHSFGGLLTIFLAAEYGERVERAILLDAAGKLHPEVRRLIQPSLDRLGKVFPLLDEYLHAMRAMAYLCGAWDDTYEAYYRAEALVHEDGTVTARPQAANIAEAIDHALGEDWYVKLKKVQAPTLLLRAPEGYGTLGTPPVLLEADARETASALAHCRYEEVPGNHATMMFQPAVQSVADALRRFLDSEKL
jgi:pimeloyl-ACP methyl ester carboxylesterase